VPRTRGERCTWWNERSTSVPYWPVLVVLTSGPLNNRSTTLPFDLPSQHPLAPTFTKENRKRPGFLGSRLAAGETGNERAILNSEALRRGIRSNSSVLLERQRWGRYLAMSTSCPYWSRPRFS
jgi:hypothetical protein